MTFPVFASGDVLNASDMNGVGLWLVKSQAVGSGVSSVTVTGAFSADYDNFLITWQGITGTSGYSAFMTIDGSAGATYNYSGRYWPYTGAAGDTNAAASAGGFWLGIMGASFSGCLNVIQPQQATTTTCTGSSAGSTYSNAVGGYDSNTAASTAFTFVSGFGTFTGGTIRVYGYRN